MGDVAALTILDVRADQFGNQIEGQLLIQRKTNRTLLNDVASIYLDTLLGQAW